MISIVSRMSKTRAITLLAAWGMTACAHNPVADQKIPVAKAAVHRSEQAKAEIARFLKAIKLLKSISRADA